MKLVIKLAAVIAALAYAAAAFAQKGETVKIAWIDQARRLCSLTTPQSTRISPKASAPTGIFVSTPTPL